MAGSQALLGMIAGLFTIPANYLYIRDIIKGNTVPERATWFIWTIAGWTIFWSYWSVPESGQTIWVPLSYAIGASIIFFFSIKLGVGGWQPFDRYCLLASGVSLIFWWWFRSLHLVPLLVNIVIDGAGFLPTLRKVAAEPWTENKPGWTVGFIGSIVNLFAVKKISFGVLSQPVYGLLGAAVMMYFLYRPRAKRIV